MCYFFKKKNLLQFTFEKNNLLCKKREKNNLSRGKIPAPPLDIKWSVPNPLYITRVFTEATCSKQSDSETRVACCD